MTVLYKKVPQVLKVNISAGILSAVMYVYYNVQSLGQHKTKLHTHTHTLGGFDCSFDNHHEETHNKNSTGAKSLP